MIRSLLRSIGAIALSLVVAMALIIAIEGLSAIFHPFPPGADTSDPEVIKAQVEKYPHWILAVVVFLWGGTTFVSSWLATRLGTNRHPAHGVVVGSLLFLAVIFNMLMLPYPAWFEVANYLVFPLAIFLALKVGRGRDKAIPPKNFLEIPNDQ
jgi:hypothetical protein